ncbi:hypothetical protein BDZ85DRAFT_134792 [Elsinoe ampelina]|uniref:Uncharacterized protein n=1 Tax=Elsinoe ampelina TaxID=302913 RepID=A0A6A6G884_9PEZI|nr:hypothetical protein BDZ85DRAFT_134792 [Elsinoe ampelina]
MALPRSGNSSAFQSSSSLSSISSLNTNVSASTSPMASQDSQFPQRFSAPLPSPSQTTQAQHYFASLQMQTQQAPPQPSPQQASFMGQRGGQGGMPETAPFLNNLNLVAEAAKRAQMACLMRDFGECEL